MIQNLVFIVAVLMAVGSGFMVIISRNPVRSALFLVLAFFSCSILWILLEAEFLALILIFVYVGAVMTLFLFVVMMLYLSTDRLKKGFVHYLPIGVLIVAGMVALMLFAIAPNHFADLTPEVYGSDYSNIKSLGEVLYTDYVYPFEVAAVLLLVAIIAAISLSHRGQSKNKAQSVAKQINARPEERIKLVKMPGEQKTSNGDQR